MTDIEMDAVTGLPVLPEGQYWYVAKDWADLSGVSVGYSYRNDDDDFPRIGVVTDISPATLSRAWWRGTPPRRSVVASLKITRTDFDPRNYPGTAEEFANRYVRYWTDVTREEIISTAVELIELRELGKRWVERPRKPVDPVLLDEGLMGAYPPKSIN